MNICDTSVNEFPSYLQDLFGNQFEVPIYLVFLNKKEDENIRATNINFNLNETENSSYVDVIGNPLEVDLKGEDSLMIEDFHAETIQHWSENENNHLPLSIKEARNYLNSRSQSTDPVFVVCDGDNPVKTVILGVRVIENKKYTCTVNILGCFAKNHEKISSTSMEKSHLLLIGSRQSNIAYVVTLKYFVFGTFLQNIKNVYATERFGSICIETTVNKKCNLDDLDDPCNKVDIMKLVVQIVAGHKKSSINFLWEDLVIVYNFVNILNMSKGDPDIVICKNPMSANDIYTSIKEISHINLIRRELKNEFCLENIRMPNIIDKLWNIVKNCEDLRNLRDAFHYFFEELADSESDIRLPQDCTSNMATIINGILDGKLAVPTIGYAEALEFLIEIGTEKLKSDYQTIIKQFFKPAAKSITLKWSEFESKLAMEESHRKTRITHHIKDSKITVEKCITKLNYLLKMHIATQFIYLVKNYAFLPETTFEYICKEICECYIAKSDIIYEFKDVIEKPVCTFDVSINNCANIVKGKIPDFCAIRMISVKSHLEAQTVYLLSKYAIFPPTIYDNYDIAGDEENTLYYAYKSESCLVTE